jgi:hypothetical protein
VEVKMRKSLVFIFLTVFMISLIPTPAQAVSISHVKFFPCIDWDGTYKLTIRVDPAVYNGFGSVDTVQLVKYYGYVRIRMNGGPWRGYFYGEGGLTLKYGELPEGTKFEVQEGYFNGVTTPAGALNGGPITHSITLKGKDYPACFKKCEGNPVFKMYLLTREDSYCILVSDVHPSVESQKALCFPGTDWVATNTACEGYVCDNGCWDCDYLGFSRETLKELWEIYQRRMGQ